MSILNKNFNLLKGRVQYFGSGLGSFLRVVFSVIIQVILSAQKAAVRYFIRIHVYPKRNKLRLQNQTIVSLLNLDHCCYWTHRLVKSEGFRDYRICYNTGNMHGILHMRTSHRISVAGETRKYFSTSLGELENGSASLHKNIEEEKLNPNWFRNDKNLFERAVSVEALKRAWYMIKSKPGMLTKGTDDTTLNKLSESWFVTTNKKLLEGSFKYPTRRRVLIDKSSGGKRPLTIANPRIKIIERALLNALEPIFEGYYHWESIPEKEYNLVNSTSLDKLNFRKVKSPNKVLYQKKNIINETIFSPHSYGFRRGKSAHQALHEVKHWRTNTVFFLDYDISKAFDNINRKRLKNIFNSKVHDKRFWMEISKILNSGVILELEQLFERKGVAQGSVLSPFLFNIYLNELDQKIITLQKKTRYTHKSHESVVYGNKEAELSYRKLSRDFATDNLKRALKKYGTKEALLEARKTAYKEHHKKYGRRKGIDLDVRHIQYVRYADDFLIGIVGSREYAVQVKKDLNIFLKGSLHLNVKKDNLVHRNDNAINFLGHRIKLSEFKVKTSAKPKQIRAARKNKNKSIARFLESDKRLARAKSYQLYSNVLTQFGVISEKLKMKLKDEKHKDSLSLLFAYRSIGSIIMKKLLLTSWNQFSELLTLMDSPNFLLKKPINPAIARWISYLTTEADRLNEFNATILRDKLTSLAKSEFSKEMSIGQADKIKEIQLLYLNDLNRIIDESLNPAIEKRRQSVIKKFNINIKAPSGLNSEEKDLLYLAKELTILGADKSSPRRITIQAPIKDTFAKFRLKGYVHPIKDKAIGNSKLQFHTDSEIVLHFNSVIRGLLSWFSGADNFSKVKGLAQLLRKSCVLTLANKHKKNQNWVYTVYGSEITVKGKEQNKIMLITRSNILNYSNKFNLKSDESSMDHFDLDNMIGKIFKLNHSLEFFANCAVKDCSESENIEVHHIRRLHRKVESDGNISVLNLKGERVKGLAAILTTLNRKQIPLCHKHHLEFESGKFSPLDYNKLNVVLGNIPKPKNSDFKPIFDGKPFILEKSPK